MYLQGSHSKMKKDLQKSSIYTEPSSPRVLESQLTLQRQNNEVSFKKNKTIGTYYTQCYQQLCLDWEIKDLLKLQEKDYKTLKLFL